MSRWESQFWRNSADDVLAPLFAHGRQPSKQELFDAYPFGERRQLPYKTWLQQVHWWQAGCPSGLHVDGKPKNVRGRHHEPVPQGQEPLL